MTTKRTMLKRVQLLSEFNAQKGVGDALPDQYQEYYKSHKETKRAYDQERNKHLTPGQKAKHRARIRAYQARWPEKTRAHKSVHKALRSGLLTRQPCERCNSTNRVHAHHEDYTKPLEVIWLCSSCHGERHRELNNSQ